MESINPIWFGEDSFNQLQNLIEKGKYSKLLFLVDENTHDKCLPYLLQSLSKIPHYEVLEVEPGEESKSAEVLVQLWMALSELKVDRQALMINVGGGMITDLGGFLAGTYLRGIHFVNVPTSLLAMVDASSGGKNGINLQHLKNRVGLFLNPEAVCVIPDFLETLPEQELRSGFAEMLKHGLIADKAYWEELATFDIENEIPTQEMILRSIQIKKEIVEQDFRETGLRKALNFGHTIGHAIETAAMDAEPLMHGEAIALGMIAELYLSEKYTALPPADAEKCANQIRALFRDLEWNCDIDELLQLMQSDKKNKKNQIRFSLLREIGVPEVDVAIGEKGITEALDYLKQKL